MNRYKDLGYKELNQLLIKKREDLITLRLTGGSFSQITRAENELEKLRALFNLLNEEMNIAGRLGRLGRLGLYQERRELEARRQEIARERAELLGEPIRVDRGEDAIRPGGGGGLHEGYKRIVARYMELSGIIRGLLAINDLTQNDNDQLDRLLQEQNFIYNEIKRQRRQFTDEALEKLDRETGYIDHTQIGALEAGQNENAAIQIATAASLENQPRRGGIRLGGRLGRATPAAPVVDQNGNADIQKATAASFETLQRVPGATGPAAVIPLPPPNPGVQALEAQIRALDTELTGLRNTEQTNRTLVARAKGIQRPPLEPVQILLNPGQVRYDTLPRAVQLCIPFELVRTTRDPATQQETELMYVTEELHKTIAELLTLDPDNTTVKTWFPKIQVTADGLLQGLGYDVEFTPRTELDVQLNVQEVLHARELLQITLPTLVAKENKTEEETQREEQYRKEFRQEHASRVANPTTYPTMVVDETKVCGICAEGASAEMPLYRLHYHTVTKSMKAKLEEQTRLFEESKKINPPNGDVEQGGRIERMKDAQASIEDGNDMYCAGCYLNHFNGNVKNPTTNQPVESCPCPIVTCKRELTAHELWHVVKQNSVEEEHFHKNRLLDEILGSLSNPEGNVEANYQLFSEMNRNELLQLLQQSKETIERIKQKYSAKKKEGNLGKTNQSFRENYKKATPRPIYDGNERTEEQKAWNTKFQQNLRTFQQRKQIASQQIRITEESEIKNSGIGQQLSRAIPTLQQRLSNLLSLRAKLKSEKVRPYLERLTTQRLETLENDLQTATTAVTTKTAELATKRTQLQAEREQNALAQQRAAFTAAVNDEMDRRLNVADGASQAYRRLVQRFEAARGTAADEYNTMYNHLTLPPLSMRLFCPYCAGSIVPGESNNCNYIELHTDWGHNCIGPNRHPILEYNGGQRYTAMCVICGGSATGHSHINLFNNQPDHRGGGFTTQNPRHGVRDEEDRRLGQNNNSHCKNYEGGGGMQEGVARVLAFRDYAREAIAANQNNFVLRFEDMTIKANQYAKIIRGQATDTKNVVARVNEAVRTDRWAEEILPPAPPQPNRIAIQGQVVAELANIPQYIALGARIAQNGQIVFNGGGGGAVAAAAVAAVQPAGDDENANLAAAMNASLRQPAPAAQQRPGLLGLGFFGL